MPQVGKLDNAVVRPLHHGVGVGHCRPGAGHAGAGLMRGCRELWLPTADRDASVQPEFWHCEGLGSGWSARRKTRGAPGRNCRWLPA